MKNKKMFLFLTVISFVFSMHIVCAETITCDYGERKIVFYTDKYDDSDYGHWADVYDKNGRDTRERIDKIKISNDSQCPSEIYVDHDTISFYISSSSTVKKYELIDSSTNIEDVEKGRTKVNCGNITEIPKKIPKLTSMAITIIEIAVPVILVVMGMMDLFKGVTAQKEDEIKKGQQTFIKRLIVAGLIFFVIVIVKLLVSIIADASSSKNIVDCIDCFLSGNCS